MAASWLLQRLLNKPERQLHPPVGTPVVRLSVRCIAMRNFSMCTILIIVPVLSHAFPSTFRNIDDGAPPSPSAFSSSYDADLLEPLALTPDVEATTATTTTLPIYSHEAESQSSLFASSSDGISDRGDSAVKEGQDDGNGGKTQEPIGDDGKDECNPPTSRRNGGKMRVRQLSCPAEPMQDNGKGPVTGQKTESAPRQTSQPYDIPETQYYIPLQFLPPDEEYCSPSLSGKGTFFSAPNTPVCSTGLDQTNFPLGPKAKFVTLQECFPCKSFLLPINGCHFKGGGRGEVMIKI